MIVSLKQKLIYLDFRSQKNKEGGAGNVRISTFRAVPVPVTPEEKRAAKRRREEEEYERGLEQMAEDIPEIKIDHERSKKDPDFMYYQATDTEDSDSDIGDIKCTKRRNKHVLDLHCQTQTCSCNSKMAVLQKKI